MDKETCQAYEDAAKEFVEDVMRRDKSEQMRVLLDKFQASVEEMHTLNLKLEEAETELLKTKSEIIDLSLQNIDGETIISVMDTESRGTPLKVGSYGEYDSIDPE